MFGHIKFISDNIAHVENTNPEEASGDLMNTHVIFEAPDQWILGEVNEVGKEDIKIRFLGEYVNKKYLNGVIRKPLLTSTIRMINDEELRELVGTYDDTTFDLGISAIYKDFNIYPKINDLLSNHFAVFGNSGSGKSWGVARVIQSLFANPNLISYNANIFIFDAYGEYRTAFDDLYDNSQYYNYKFITTNMQGPKDHPLNIPIFLLDMDDMALLLQAHDHSQLPIIERTLRLCKIFSQNDETAKNYKNHLIAKALLAVLFSNQTTASKKNDVFRVIEACSTPNFNFDTRIQGIGYDRSFAECFEIDSNGNFGESVLINEYILGWINDDLESTPEPPAPFYTIEDFSKALEFTLISEGFQNNSQLYDDAIMLKVRLHSILNSKVYQYFQYPEYITRDKYVSSLVVNGNKKAQIININLEDIDDVYAKVICKVLSKMFFEFAKSRTDRASIPFHIFLEEAHRYVQKDADTFLIGYNIFDRISKEGRKYGVLLNIISQRPVELSDTVISQCSNFLIFKMTHPKDITYIKEMLPNISSDVVEKQKILQPGTCVGFGSAFKIPMIIKMEKPNPTPHSNSCDVNARWKLQNKANPVSDIQNIEATEGTSGGGTPLSAPTPIPTNNVPVDQVPLETLNISPAPVSNIITSATPITEEKSVPTLEQPTPISTQTEVQSLEHTVPVMDAPTPLQPVGDMPKPKFMDSPTDLSPLNEPDAPEIIEAHE